MKFQSWKGYLTSAIISWSCYIKSESLELEKVNNAISVNTKLNSQVQVFKDLKSVKHHYGELSQFVLTQQGKYRRESLEGEYLKELKEFCELWEKVMKDFQKLAQDEVVKVIQANKDLQNEYFEIVEKVTGFRPPPDTMFLNLLAIRKIAIQLKSTEAVQFLNFDYFKKRNIHLNEKWIKDRKEWLLKKIKLFEERLMTHLKLVKARLNEELWKLHVKRLKQFDRLTTKYIKCQNLVAEVNSKENFKLQKMKKFFLLRNDVPSMSYYEYFRDEEAPQRAHTINKASKTKTLDLDEEKPLSQRTVEKAAKNKKPPKA